MLFLLDMDNAVYQYLLPESHCANMQEVGRPENGEEEQTMLLRTRWLYAIVVPLSAPLSLYGSVSWGDDAPGILVAIGIVTIMIAAEHLTRIQYGAPVGGMVLSFVAKSVVSMITFFAILVAAVVTGLL